ncbi:MAG: putative RNA methyltransferase [Enterococcus sp.]
MLKKIDQGKQFVSQNSTLFRCPLCQQGMQAKQAGLVCERGHRFDVSKKGTLFFLNRQVSTDYNQKMFVARGRMIQSGMYQPLLKKITDLLAEEEIVLDVGCGEGSFLNLVSQMRNLTGIGFDISKEGVYLASNQMDANFWCVADLTNLPFESHKFTTILNIFSPSNYREFQRILLPKGQVIKVVPRSGYLKELRQAFYPDDVDKQQYSNQPVIAKFSEAFSESEHFEITYTFDVPKERQLDLLEMSPLEWGVSQTVKQQLQANPLDKITIDLDILVGKNV